MTIHVAGATIHKDHGPKGRRSAVYSRAMPARPGDPPSLDTFSDGDLHIDFAERRIIYDVRPASLRNRVELHPWEVAALAVLVQHRHERPLWGPELSEWAWGNTDDEAAKRTIKVIARLHFKLGQTDLPRCPVVVAPGFGYWYRTLNP